MKNNRKLTLLLVLVLAVIWGSIGFQIVSALDDTEPVVGSEFRKTDTANIDAVKYVYKDDVRDPFRFFEPQPQSKVKIIKTSPTFILSPPYKLTGIIADKQKKTALLEATDGSIYFMKEGDSLQGLRVVRITEKKVTYSYFKNKGEWSVN